MADCGGECENGGGVSRRVQSIDEEANTYSSGKITELGLGGSDDRVENGLHCGCVYVFCFVSFKMVVSNWWF